MRGRDNRTATENVRFDVFDVFRPGKKSKKPYMAGSPTPGLIRSRVKL